MAKKDRQTDIRGNARPSPIPAPVAAIASLILPGLGQVMGLSIQRGLLLFGSTAAIFPDWKSRTKRK